MVQIVRWCPIYEPCVWVAGSFYQQHLKDSMCRIRHCSKALRWQEKVKDSHAPIDLQDNDISLPFPSLRISNVLLIRPHEWIQYRNQILPCRALSVGACAPSISPSSGLAARQCRQSLPGLWIWSVLQYLGLVAYLQSTWLGRTWFSTLPPSGCSFCFFLGNPEH